MKISAEIFGYFGFISYLCTIEIKAGRTTRCSWSNEYLIPQKSHKV